MRIIIFGASGEIGKAVVAELAPRHEIVQVGKTRGDFQVDMTDAKRARSFFQSIGPFDALIAAAGIVHFAPMAKMTPELYQIGLENKLMGQVNLVLIGREYIQPNGSFTLTSGILSHEPIASGSSASMVNGAIEAFVKAAAIELPSGLRINGVSPTILTESMPKLANFFRGFDPVPAKKAALGYSRSVEGLQTGQIYRIE